MSDTFPLAKKIGIVQPAANLDYRYGPWPTIQRALEVTAGLRQLGLTVAISSISTGAVEYHFKNGITDTDLIIKSVDLSGYLPLSGGALTGNLTTTSSFSTNNIIYAKTGNSDQWNSNFFTVCSLSSNLNSVYNIFNTNSGRYESVFSNVNANSANNQNNYTTFNTNSGKYESVFSNVNSNSAKYESNYTIFNTNSGKYESVFSNVNSNSSNWNSVFSNVNTNSSNNQSVYTIYNTNSGKYESVFSNVNSNSANIQNVLTNVNANSGNWNSVYSSWNNNSAFDISARTFVNNNSANINQVNTWVNNNSGNANFQLNSLSGKWESTFNTTCSLSSNWNSVYSTWQSTSGFELSARNLININGLNWNSVYSSVCALSSSWSTISIYDSALNLSSTNAVQNSAIAFKIQNIENNLNLLVPAPTGYLPPTASLTNFNTTNYEVGQVIVQNLNLNWNQNLAGSAISFTLYRNNILQAQLPASFVYPLNEVVELGTTTFKNVVSYNNGPILNNILGNPDSRGRILADSVETSRSYTGRYIQFYGSVAIIPINLRTLPLSSFDNVNSFSIQVTENNTVLTIPDNKSLILARTENFQNVTSAFTLSATSVKDASGVDRPYKRYVQTTSVPFNLRIDFTLA
jgi:hypothetical protein